MPDTSTKPVLKFHNTLTRAKEEFRPIDAENVRMYVCGPTVYDFAHIGNARPAIVFDVLFRLLRHVYGADHVTYVRNITDVDDKINARALRDYPDLPLNEAIAKVTERTAQQYFRDVAALGCLEPSAQPRATAHIAGMITMIQTLIDKGNAYLAKGREGREVLFSVGTMAAYGQLSNRKLEDQQAGARVAVEDHKRNPADFVLWKESAADQPGWPATFREDDETSEIYGRPGWHIECSVMSEANLGETFDIHGGGLDLIFPHHENEIAQSTCAHGGKAMANYWMHNGFLQVEGRKMSKSEGNFVTIAEMLANWPGEVLRWNMLRTNYRQPIDWTMRGLQESRRNLLAMQRSYDPMLPEALGYEPDFDRYAVDEEFLASLKDDLGTNPATTRLLALSSEVQADALSGSVEADRKRMELSNSLRLLGFDRLHEFAHRGIGNQQTINSRIAPIVQQRLALIADKNWAEADRIRDELLEQGIQLKDGKDSETGERVTTWEVKR